MSSLDFEFVFVERSLTLSCVWWVPVVAQDVVHSATIVTLSKESQFTSISRGLREQLKVVLKELKPVVFL